jgi:hypothetical protein
LTVEGQREEEDLNRRTPDLVRDLRSALRSKERVRINAENTENKEGTEFTEKRKGKRRKKMPPRKIREGSADGD